MGTVTPQDSAGNAQPAQAAQALRPRSEAMLAPQADPFAPLSTASLPAPQERAPAVQPSQPVVERLPNLPAGMQLRPLIPPMASNPLEIKSGSERDADSAAPPELIGTLIGEHPSAVFRSKDGVVIIAAGKTIGPWRVSRVVHGGVILVNGRRRVSLGTSMAGAVYAQQQESGAVDKTVQVAEQPAPAEVKPAPAESAPSPFLVAEAVTPVQPFPVTESTPGSPAPTPAPQGDEPAPAPPVIQETAPPPKPPAVTEEPKKQNDTK
jgi:hypothetical protein